MTITTQFVDLVVSSTSDPTGNNDGHAVAIVGYQSSSSAAYGSLESDSADEAVQDMDAQDQLRELELKCQMLELERKKIQLARQQRLTAVQRELKDKSSSRSSSRSRSSKGSGTSPLALQDVLGEDVPPVSSGGYAKDNMPIRIKDKQKPKELAAPKAVLDVVKEEEKIEPERPNRTPSLPTSYAPVCNTRSSSPSMSRAKLDGPRRYSPMRKKARIARIIV